MKYAKIRDILYVMKMLGHKSIKNTLIYTQLIQGTEKDEFISQLTKLGFEHICEQNGLKVFMKRK